MRLSEKALENETCIGMFTTWEEEIAATQSRSDMDG
jgi:hypothetical protein